MEELEELEDKILSGDFDEYTFNRYVSLLETTITEKVVNKACAWLHRGIDPLNRGASRGIIYKESVDAFRQFMLKDNS